ncbi:hypothetical protein [Bradyrhizobium sp. WU425]|uniref:hypothetical protein n=1 Tax=Bradyrhizobium sp. WU425 TaxID=187029 RepID=UPI001E590ACC|nr:hypothetical protein [Bradyrhizobium canariense]UFW75223.1 hypothetical protein BcanWU425_16215 [Bradyrhizobium canariense]
MSKLLVRQKPRRQKFCYVGAPAIFRLELACQKLEEAWPDAFGCYLVGSCLERPDFRDVDVRMIMKDEDFAREFPDCHSLDGHWEHDPKWLVMTVALAGWLREQTGLPIDFQFQPQTFANKHHAGTRHAIGLRYVSRRKQE